MPSDPDTQCCLSEASLGAHFKCHFSGCLLRPHSRARPSCCLPLLVYVCALCPGFPASSSFIISPLATRALSPALLSTSVPGLSTLSLLCCHGLLWLHSGLAPPRPRHVLRSRGCSLPLRFDSPSVQTGLSTSLVTCRLSHCW